MGMRLRAALRGDLRRGLAEEERVIGRAMKDAMKEASDGLRSAMADQTKTVGLGNRLARTWRNRTYPNGPSMAASAFVWSKAPVVIRAHSEGARIRSADGFFLAVPTENAPKRGVGGKRISPATWPDHSHGRLRFVYRKSGPSLLVADDQRGSVSRNTGKITRFKRAAENSRGPRATVVMFILLPQVRIRKKLYPERAAKHWQGRLPKLIAKHHDRQQAYADYERKG